MGTRSAGEINRPLQDMRVGVRNEPGPFSVKRVLKIAESEASVATHLAMHSSGFTLLLTKYSAKFSVLFLLI